MPMTYDEAVQIMRRHEARLMALPGVKDLNPVLRDGAPVLEIRADPDVDLPAELVDGTDLDGLPVQVLREPFELQ
jgi:hypothetical protein